MRQDDIEMTTNDETQTAELQAAVTDFAAGGYPVNRIVDSVCSCGNTTFALVFNDDDGVAARICAACELELGIADSDERFDDVDEVQQAECSCGNDTFHVATGFALDTDGEVRWVSVGLLCTSDGVAGVYVDWKIDYRPSTHLFANA
jgi:hypothetical protein